MSGRLGVGRAPDEGTGHGSAVQPPGARILGSHERPIPTSLPRQKTRDVKWKAFENARFKSVADPAAGENIGDQGFDSLEDDLERWRQTIVGTENDRALLEWSYQFDGTTHYVLVTYAE